MTFLQYKREQYVPEDKSLSFPILLSALSVVVWVIMSGI